MSVKRRISMLVIAAIMLLLTSCGRNDAFNIANNDEQESEVQGDDENAKVEQVSEMSNKVVYETIPDEYRQEADERGEIQSIDYQTDGGEKEAYVYLPYGYDENDTDVRYDIIYMMHGGGGSAAEYLGTPSSPNYVKNAVDNLIEKSEINPVIIVAPTFYSKGDNDASVSNASVLTEKFPTEFINDLMPKIEETYHTYAESVSLEGLKASREHRAFGGFSMGSVTTWYMFADALDYVSKFIPESGDCWIVEQMGGANVTEETVEKLKEAVINRGFDSSDFIIYAATGTEDIAYSQLNAQIEEMKTESEVFKFSVIKGEGNLYYNLAEGMTHDYGPSRDYFYDALKFLYGIII